MYKRTEEEMEQTVGLPSHGHFIGFFNDAGGLSREYVLRIPSVS